MITAQTKRPFPPLSSAKERAFIRSYLLACFNVDRELNLIAQHRLGKLRTEVEVAALQLAGSREARHQLATHTLLGRRRSIYIQRHALGHARQR